MTASFLYEAKKGKIMSELRFEWKNMLAADLGEESCVPDLLGERILQNSLKFYLDETDEIYEGYGKVADSYPYRQRNNYKRQLKQIQWSLDRQAFKKWNIGFMIICFFY